MTTDRRSFDISASQTVQGDLAGIVGRLEGLIATRNADVATAMADFQADGVSDDYQIVETRWKNAAGEVQRIIDLVKTTLLKNDETATTTLTQARNAVLNIG